MQTTLDRVYAKRTSLETTYTSIEGDEWADPVGQVLTFSITTNVGEEFWDRLNAGTEILIIDGLLTMELVSPVAPLHCRNLFVLSINVGCYISTAFVLCLPPHFSELYVDCGSVDEYGVDFSSLVFLTHLRLSACGIEDVSGFVFPNRAFYLDLSFNCFDLSGLRGVDKILGLSLRYCALVGLACYEFPRSLGELNLSKTGLTDLSELRDLPFRLRFLNLSGNRLRNLDGWKPPSGLVNVDMSFNDFDDFPRFRVGGNLKMLNFTCSTIVPSDIYPLFTQVQYLSNGRYEFIAASDRLIIQTTACKLSDASVKLQGAILHAKRKGGSEKANHYLNMVTAMVALCSASHVPVAGLPSELCRTLCFYLYNE